MDGVVVVLKSDDTSESRLIITKPEDSSTAITASLERFSPEDRVTTMSTMLTLFTGTRREVPMTLPASDGISAEMDLLAPVECGMMLLSSERDVRFLKLVVSVVCCEAVHEWIVVKDAFSIPYVSSRTL
jgi:hypothetical protein